MMFDDLPQKWASAKTLGQRRKLWEDLTGPARGWFNRCRQAVVMRDSHTLESWLSSHDAGAHPLVGAYGAHVADRVQESLRQSAQQLSDADKQAITNTLLQEAIDLLQAHLRCALAVVRHDHWPSVPKQTLQPVAKQTRLPLGFLYDLAHELYCEALPRPAHQQALTVLLVDTGLRNASGIVATLTLEAIPHGTGALYPVPVQAFACWDWQFRQAAQVARCYVQRVGLWQEGWDVRWRIQVHSAQSIAPLLGPSLGAAFALGLAKLMADGEQTPAAERLYALDLAQVTITATIDASGLLGEVGYLWEKLLAAAQEAAAPGLLRLGVVAADQPHVPLALLKPEAAPLRLIQVAKLEEAIDKLFDIQRHIPTLRLNFAHLIETHTHFFAGRTSILQSILDFINTESCGYIFVEGLSGYGKTSLLAKLVQDHQQFAYHFISQTYKAYGTDFDPTEMESLLLNLCEQLESSHASSGEHHSPKARFHTLLHSSPANGPRVIVIDAVDEINRHPNYLRGLLPTSLPAGVFVILSARTLGDRNYLHEIGLETHQIGKIIHIPGLDEKAIMELLALAGGVAGPLGHSPDFVHQLHRVSEGDPFYLRFLIEDIARGAITPQNVAHTPSGLSAYLDMQLALLDRSAYLPQQQDILGIILEAHDAVSRNDLIEMIEGLNGLNFENIVRDIHRFLLKYKENYTFCHNRFKEYFMSKML